MPRLVLDPHDPRLVDLQTLAGSQGQVVSRRQVYACGLTRWHVRGQVRARRWSTIGDQSVCLHRGLPSTVGQWWAAVFQGGPRAQLDGATALVAGGLERFTADQIRVSVPRGARVRRTPLFDIRQTRRWSAADVVSSGIPRTRPAIAAVRGAMWAVTDRQAALLLTMAVQQRLTTPREIGTELLRVKRDKRRRLMHAVVLDLLDGAESLGELDVAAMLRCRGLPHPDRQVLRRVGGHRYYLDLYWKRWRLVVEIDGIQHAWAENIVADALRQNALSIAGDRVLRLPVLGLRLEPDRFLAQIEAALIAQGWSRAA